MIRAEIIRARPAERIVGFRVEGHALYARRGKDIVCAGVSAVTVGAVNAAEEVAGVVLDKRMEPGLLHARVPDGTAEANWESLQVVLESMVVMLKTIERSYGSHIRVTEIYE